MILLLMAGCGIPPAGTPPLGNDTSTLCDEANEGCSPGTCGGEGANMLPGSNCLACHTGGEGGRFTAGGTAFADIDGTSPLKGAIVRITDVNGTVKELSTNSAGNFYTGTTLAFPINAEIEYNGTVIPMSAEVTTGACDTCHTCTGTAGGKIYGP